MSHKATFTLDGKTYPVLTCHYSLHQNVDSTGRPASDVRGGTISLSVESSENNAIYQWMTDTHGFKDGKITFFKRDQDSKLKELEFKQGACVDFSESFHAGSSGPMAVTFTISAKEITMGGDSHKNTWAV